MANKSIQNRQLDFLKNQRGTAFGKTEQELRSILSDSLFEEAMTKIFQQIVDTLKQNLIDSNANASRNLTESINFEIDNDGKTITAKISLDKYYRLVDEGVRGFYSSPESAEDSPFQYKSPLPGYKIMNALKKWITRKGVKIEYNRNQPRTRKKLKEAQDARKSLAWAIASKVKQDGTEATRFFSSVINEKTIRQIEQDLSTQMGVFISVQLTGDGSNG